MIRSPPPAPKVRENPKVGFENSLIVGPGCQCAGVNPGALATPKSAREDLLVGGAADDPTWRSHDDTGVASTGAALQIRLSS